MQLTWKEQMELNLLIEKRSINIRWMSQAEQDRYQELQRKQFEDEDPFTESRDTLHGVTR